MNEAKTKDSEQFRRRIRSKAFSMVLHLARAWDVLYSAMHCRKLLGGGI